MNLYLDNTCFSYIFCFNIQGCPVYIHVNNVKELHDHMHTSDRVTLISGALTVQCTDTVDPSLICDSVDGPSSGTGAVRSVTVAVDTLDV